MKTLISLILIAILVVAILVALVWVIVWFALRLVRRFKKPVINQDLLDEIHNLKKQILKVTQEKDRILRMKVTGAEGDAFLEGLETEEGEEESGDEKKLKEGESRFFKLTEVDQIYENYTPPEYDNEITLAEICDRFRNFAASRLRLYYEPRIIRLFWAGMSTTRLLILQGISGTGKTSLAYATGQFLDNPATLDYLATGLGAGTNARAVDYAAFKEEQYDKLAALVREHVDMDYIYASLSRP